MHTDSTKITGILLAGGLSKRMGTEKGILRIGKALLYQYPLGLMEKICDEILISTCNTNIFQLNHKLICDEVKGIGPLGGIYSCLKQSSNDWNLVLSYDMPLVNEALLKLLIKKRGSHEIVLPALQNKQAEPLCGLYKKYLTQEISRMIKQQDFAVNHLLNRCDSKIIPVSEDMECWHPDLFLNVNSPEDLHRLPEGFGIK